MKTNKKYILVFLALTVIFISGCQDIGGTFRPGSFGNTQEEKNVVDVITAKYGDLTQRGNPRFLELTMTSAIHNSIPIDSVTKYSKDTNSFYFWFVYDNFNNDELNIEWKYLDTDHVIHTFVSQTGDNFGRGSFILDQPDGGWPLGTYQVTLSGRGISEAITFEVIDGPTVKKELEIISTIVSEEFLEDEEPIIHNYMGSELIIEAETGILSNAGRYSYISDLNRFGEREAYLGDGGAKVSYVIKSNDNYIVNLYLKVRDDSKHTDGSRSGTIYTNNIPLNYEHQSMDTDGYYQWINVGSINLKSGLNNLDVVKDRTTTAALIFDKIRLVSTSSSVSSETVTQNEQEKEVELKDVPSCMPTPDTSLRIGHIYNPRVGELNREIKSVIPESYLLPGELRFFFAVNPNTDYTLRIENVDNALMDSSDSITIKIESIDDIFNFYETLYTFSYNDFVKDLAFQENFRTGNSECLFITFENPNKQEIPFRISLTTNTKEETTTEKNEYYKIDETLLSITQEQKQILNNKKIPIPGGLLNKFEEQDLDMFEQVSFRIKTTEVHVFTSSNIDYAKSWFEERLKNLGWNIIQNNEFQDAFGVGYQIVSSYEEENSERRLNVVLYPQYPGSNIKTFIKMRFE